MKIKYLILCFVASLLASCGEIDESNLKLYPSKLYLGVSGYNLQEIYDLGEESLVWDVYVDKSGYYDNAAEVELSYDPTVDKPLTVAPILLDLHPALEIDLAVKKRLDIRSGCRRHLGRYTTDFRYDYSSNTDSER